MKYVKNQQGYALLVVLLVVVMFLGLSAAFMAASLSNSKQEQTVDISNQSVALAEMGVRYFSADFQREMGIIKSGIIEITQNRIKGIVDCFNSGDSTCNDKSELTALKNGIDEDMRTEFISKVVAKVSEIRTMKGEKYAPFPDKDVYYAIADAALIKLNTSGEDVDLADTSDKYIKTLEVKLQFFGESRGNQEQLKAVYAIQVPDSFLSTTDSLAIRTTSINEVKMSYADMFITEWPTLDCTALMNAINNGTTPEEKRCLLGTDQKVAEFVSFLMDKNLDPKDYTVFSSSFTSNICQTGCNNISLQGITVITNPDEGGLFDTNVLNLNSLANMNLVVDSATAVNPLNMNSLGKHGKMQTLIFRELAVSGNIQGGGLTNTNLLILGKEFAEPGVNPNSTMIFDGNLTIGDNGRICFDMDRIHPDHVQRLGNIAKFANNNTTGQIIYYTSNPTTNRFFLTNAAKQEDKERTVPYVIGYDNYTTFLSSCGIDVTNKTIEILNLPYPYIQDPKFIFKVEY